ncbi:MAG TPA: alpha-L-fucosidase, partial [Roseimicrobium sp.]|nr:alpha-L-fucosidase [Roseimicrobium sp.]
DKKAIPQIRELITQYHPKLLWFDTPSKLPNSENIRILDSVRTADPSVVVNGRLVRNAGDYTNTGDRAVEFRRINGDWEAIPTTNESYGWSPLDNSYKTPDFLIRVLEKAVSRGGNILLNIGPTRDGTIDPNDVAILEGIGRWMSINSESIYGCGAAPLPTQAWGVVTAKKTTLYLHVLNWPAGPLVVGGLESTPRSAHMLTATGEIPVTYQRVNQQDLAFTLPAKPPSASPAVIRLEFDTAPQGGGVRLIDTIVATNQILAFDAELHGQHFSFGDGKQDNYTVYNWTSTDQFLTWQVRLNQPARFDVALHYGTVNGGDYTIEVSDWRATRTAPPYVGAPPRIYPTQTDSLGTVSLPAGIHTITLRANKISGKGEFIRPLELFLKSASK